MGNSNTKESRVPGATGSLTQGSTSALNLLRAAHDRDRTTDREKRKAKRKEGYEMIVDPSETVDGGFLFPQGIYKGSQDFKVSVVRELIACRRMAPFYKPLDNSNPNWTDAELLQALNIEVDSDDSSSSHSGRAKASSSSLSSSSEHRSPTSSHSPIPETASPQASDKAGKEAQAPLATQLASLRLGPDSLDSEAKAQAVWLYRNVHECPICFMLYPRLNSTKCCGQDICTECFVQIKRAPPHRPYGDDHHPTENAGANAATSAAAASGAQSELVSEPALCPYCTAPGLTLQFEAPPFEWGLHPDTFVRKGKSALEAIDLDGKRGVSTDMIRPDWKAQLDSARRRLARKSAAAQAIHRSALLPADAPSSFHRRTQSSAAENAPRRRRRSTLSDMVTTSRAMSSMQMRELENRMLESAIQQSLREQ